LEFNIPFQHKYGYIRDEGVAGGYLKNMKYKKQRQLEPLLEHCSSTSQYRSWCQKQLSGNHTNVKQAGACCVSLAASRE